MDPHQRLIATDPSFDWQPDRADWPRLLIRDSRINVALALPDGYSRASGSNHYIGHTSGTNSGITPANATGPHDGGLFTNDNTANVTHDSTVSDAELWDSFIATQFNDDIGPTIGFDSTTATEPFANDNTANVTLNGTEADDAYLYGHFQMPGSDYPLITTNTSDAAPQTTAVPAAAPNATTSTTPRPTCTHPTCTNRTFGRASDLARHMKKHQPSARRYWCSVSGCKYSRVNGTGFYRRDKLVSHQRNVHGG